ncbi:Multifunctional cytochrome P450 monooxygenase af510 [Sparassis crispa]|uniref:Multifunctional cytochrome P450 monooxygenase af510 n=1 Tax=Sparassis crispa TaxID=139825 RepID=A0A401GH90_9APHY|nr:Multifunctional cytochrome P450 monooxygenase af510 [Sparassis crispa]GBE81550.1 Multifunctional cytochrome P450 monooxygenase af510 [Sparassis crispa]
MELLNFCVTAVLLVAAVVLVLRRPKRTVPLPPGPPADPLIGHLRKLPPIHHCEIFQKWAAEYGDMFYLNVLGQSLLVVSSFKIATDLLEGRSANYSDRPRSPSLELMGWDWALTLLEYGHKWRRHRKLMQEYLNIKKLPDYYPLHIRETHLMLKNILARPAEFDWAIRRFATASIMDIAYGHRVRSDDDEFVQIAKEALDSLEAVNIGAAPVDILPILRYVPYWLPGASSLTGPAHKYRPLISKLVNNPFQMVQKQMAAGTAVPSFTSAHLERVHREGVDSEEELNDIKSLGASLYIGGVDTVTSGIRTFLYAILLFPETQRKAQEEIDRVVGTNRLPDFSDRDSLPYVDCMIQETLRWHPVIPLGVPHRSMEDDVYNGMFIPKGTYVIPNTRAMNREGYRDPDRFYPERFLPEPQGYGETHRVASFGFGRRRCAGSDFAANSMWIFIANFLATFTVGYTLDKDGKEIIPEPAFTPNVTSTPEPFDCIIKPRSAKAEALALQADE